MSTQVERIVLYMVVLALAVTVGYLAYKLQKDECAGCDGELDLRLKTMATAMTDLKKGVADAVEVASRVDGSISTHRRKTETALDGIDATMTSGIQNGLAGLEGRVADAVTNKLLATGCPLTNEENECVPAAPPEPCPPPNVLEELDCGVSPPSITVKSKFTLLYENARLTDDRDITENSFGVKLAHRHLRRLDLLANAFGPCHRSNNPVEFHVTGYSSTAEFRFQPSGRRLLNSDELNLKTANLRAQIVGTYLESKGKGFRVTTVQWPQGHDLQRPYLDDVRPGVDQQALNRTVMIELVSAGACDLSR